MDEPVQEGRLAVRGSGLGLAPIIPVGMRAVSVRVSDVAGVAGFVLPGLRVDVLVTGRAHGFRGTVTTTCLQNILVFSAGQTIQPDARGQAINTPTVTLLATPEQARNPDLGRQRRTNSTGRFATARTRRWKKPAEPTSMPYTAGRRESRSPKPEAAPTSQARRPKPVAMAAAPSPPPAPAPAPEIVVIRGNQRTVEVVPQKAN